MTAADLRACLVAPMADHGVNESVSNQCQSYSEADKIGPHANDLIVIEQQECGEAIVLDAVGNRSETVGQLGSKRQALNDIRHARTPLMRRISANLDMQLSPCIAVSVSEPPLTSTQSVLTLRHTGLSQLCLREGCKSP